MNNLLKEALHFFKKEAGFQRLLTLFIKKYKGLGRMGGSVRLQPLSSAEKETLSMFFRKDYSHQQSVTISIDQFEKALERTKFSGVDVKELLDAYHGQLLLSRVEEEESYSQKREMFFLSLSQQFQHPYCQDWLQHICDRGVGTKGIYSAYDRDQESLKNHLEHLCTALTQVSMETGTKAYIRLPLFASGITGDPHGFDRDKEAGRYLITALQVVRLKVEQEYEYVSTPSAEEVTELFQSFGIVRDDILNFATCIGILAYNEQIIPMWKAALEAGSVLNVPLRELVKADGCIPASVDLDQLDLDQIDLDLFDLDNLDLRSIDFRSIETHKRNSSVFVVENSGVFSSILDQFEPQQVPPLICTHGQFKLATLLLLDKLTKNDVTIYYSGDFDPEGLQMAQRLLQRYPQQVQLWRYDEENYLSCQSGIELSQSRLNKLASIHALELQAVKDAVLVKGKSAYQEDLVPGLIEDMKRILSK